MDSIFVKEVFRGIKIGQFQFLVFINLMLEVQQVLILQAQVQLVGLVGVQEFEEE
jgi:hypothetical protein